MYQFGSIVDFKMYMYISSICEHSFHFEFNLKSIHIDTHTLGNRQTTTKNNKKQRKNASEKYNGEIALKLFYQSHVILYYSHSASKQVNNAEDYREKYTTLLNYINGCSHQLKV